MRIREETVRFWLPVVALALFAGYCAFRLVRAHVDPDVKAIDYTFEREVPGRRGSILDRNGKALATSVPVWNYHLDPVSLTNRVVRRKGEPPRPPVAIAKTIATSLGLDFARVREMCANTRRRYQPLGESADPEIHRILSDSTLVSGVVIEDLQVRQYVRRRRLAHVLGSVNAEGVGSAGIELRYERQLKGRPGTVRGLKDARGRELYDKRIISVDPIPGADVYLTVDCNIQYEAETALADGLREYGAGSGWCIVMEARTGAILAMVSLPDFDPDGFGSAPASATLNRAVALTYEPGSVMKVVTTAAAIDSGRFGPDSMFSTDRGEDGYYKLPGDGSHVWEPRMSLRDAVVHSSNIVIGKLGCQLGANLLWQYMRAFGFGQRTGIELPGEETGILPLWSKWDRASWSRAPIGQYVAVTAIQMASAYQAIANDGRRMRPHIVARIVDPGGAEFRTTPEAIGRPISAATARTLRDVMRGVASPAGTARRAAIRGYSIAGKTGTAQKSAGRRGYVPGLYRATFCGMVPAGSPELVVLVTLDFDEKAKFHQGGNSAAPVWRRVTTAALRYLRIQPDLPDELEDVDEDDFDRLLAEREAPQGEADPDAPGPERR